jgi:hypothetical protein
MKPPTSWLVGADVSVLALPLANGWGLRSSSILAFFLRWNSSGSMSNLRSMGGMNTL